MKERPILFSSPMVRAILAGTKTQTRRIVKPQPTRVAEHTELVDRRIPPVTIPDGWQWRSLFAADERGHFAEALAANCPYGSRGDLLWVKETFAIGDDPPGVRIYKSDVHATDWRTWERFERRELRWKSSLFMRKSESRLELEVTNVRVERLHDITEDDARAEGVERDTAPCDHTRLSCEEIGCMGPTYRSTFCELWDSINGDRGGWELNPWVWVVEFRRVEVP